MCANDCEQVPTVVGYYRDHFSSWGFLTTNANDGEFDEMYEVYEDFKVCLDPAEYRNARERDLAVPPDHEHVRTCCRDFLRRIRLHIEFCLKSCIGVPWDEVRVEFMFSTPTTWASVVTNDLARLVREAGYGAGGLKHFSSVTLTEAQAVAAYTSHSANCRDITDYSASSVMISTLND